MTFQLKRASHPTGGFTVADESSSRRFYCHVYSTKIYQDERGRSMERLLDQDQETEALAQRITQALNAKEG